MQEPIKKGDCMLRLKSENNWEEINSGIDFSGFHPLDLRLPDRFQKKPDPVEEQCARVAARAEESAWGLFEVELRKLVDLARKA